MQACRGAGVTCIGLLAGGTSRADLLEAGAAAVYPTPGDLLRDLDGSPLGRRLAAAR